MSFSSYATTFAGLPVVELSAGEPLPEVDGPVAWRFSFWDYDEQEPQGQVSPAYAEQFQRLLDGIDASAVRALVLGSWGYAAFADPPIAQLCAAADRLTGLEALFLGDIPGEECEASWIRQGDITPLLRAYPRLRVLRVRGTDELRLSPVRHDHLRELAFESGGLPAHVLAAILGSDLPALEHLELWLGVARYDGDITVADLEPLLAGGRLPALHRLGLRNAEITDRIAAALAGAPLVGRLDELDLSLGTLGDEGAETLLAGQPLTHLRRLDLHHHFLSPQLAERVAEELPGVDVDVSEPQAEERWGRYTSVSE